MAYFEKEYLDSSPEETFELLNQPKDVNISANVLIQKDQIAPFDLNEGETLDIYYTYWEGNNEREINYTVKVVDFYNYWPVIYNQAPDPTSSVFRLSIITTMEDIYHLTNDPSDIYVQMLIKVADGYNVASIANTIDEQTIGRRIENIDDSVLISTGSLRATVLYGSINANFIASIFILVMSVILMMVVHNIERISEVGIMRAVGISPRQLFSYFFTEAFIVLLIGAIAGIVLGMVVSFMFMSIIAINSNIPPWEMVFEPGKLALTIAGMFVASIISAAIPGLLSANKKEAAIMREV